MRPFLFASVGSVLNNTMTVAKTRTPRLSKQQVLIVKNALNTYINFNIGPTNPQYRDFKVIINVLEEQLDD